jgi:hypothetical protein
MHRTICDYISDITQNSIEANASEIKLEIIEEHNNIKITITDNGKGMKKEMIELAKDPFYTDTNKKHKRKVGLGLPFIINAIQQSQGEISIDSENNKGTSIQFSFNKTNLDSPPLGDKALTYLQLLSYPGDFNLTIAERKNNETFSLIKNEITRTLGEINNIENLILLKQYLKDNIL